LKAIGNNLVNFYCFNITSFVLKGIYKTTILTAIVRVFFFQEIVKCLGIKNKIVTELI
jgi:hypothetical protein